MEVPIGKFVNMNILLWNCKGLLKADFKKRVFEMMGGYGSFGRQRRWKCSFFHAQNRKSTPWLRKVKRWNVEVFGNLFTRKKKVLARLNGTQKALASWEKEKLSEEVTVAEIKVGMWALKSFTALGVDGLHTRFFQRFWHEVQEAVCHEVALAFQSGAVPNYLNETLLALIPKSTFVMGRRGMDTIVIAQELIYSMDNKKGKMGFMAIKVDLEKAYDRLEWNFIHKVLRAFHFPHHLVPIKASRGNLEISHLFFADDLILFAKGSEEGSVVIKDVLDRFCAESGQKVSSDKSRIYFSRNVKADLKDKICSNLQIQATNDLGKYLGFPIRHKGAARNQFNFVAERVIKKLSGCKAKLLSFAGRTVLVKSMMSAIPNYVMQGAALPIHLCDKLDKISRDFLWGSSQGKSKMHLVGWNKIIKSKEEGGLGIQAARAKNLALLAKFNWRLYHEKDALWAKVLLNKYCSQSRRNSSDPDKFPCSSIWKAVKQGFHIFSKRIAWSVGNNSNLKF
ncbi:uncharacterized protein LOC112040231 [Quercus suber]|uniref:uncharacterized protein LOC112040231 n=1 Tax=Quercus suber TaxID=58331 RepID=UPI000CE22427|nr:uncharacterized protein LOC112040231 [Quercus suber]